MITLSGFHCISFYLSLPLFFSLLMFLIPLYESLYNFLSCSLFISLSFTLPLVFIALYYFLSLPLSFFLSFPSSPSLYLVLFQPLSPLPHYLKANRKNNLAFMSETHFALFPINFPFQMFTTENARINGEENNIVWRERKFTESY